jgi:methionyl-tRNA formyltransferase
MSTVSVGIFGDKFVGKKTVEYLFTTYREHVKFLCVTDESSELIDTAIKMKFPRDLIFIYNILTEHDKIEYLRKFEVDYIILAWWPYIVREAILSLPKKMILNFHPSFLPYNKGKNYNFWTIIEDTPYGVTIHAVDKSIDGGDIIFQRNIEKSWEDTGKTLFEKAQLAMIDLFIESYPKIIASDYVEKKQNYKEGTFHKAKELEPASQIFLDTEYKAKDLLNLLRARTFPPYPACYFFSDEQKYEVRIDIRKVDTNEKS